MANQPNYPSKFTPGTSQGWFTTPMNETVTANMGETQGGRWRASFGSTSDFQSVQLATGENIRVMTGASGNFVQYPTRLDQATAPRDGPNHIPGYTGHIPEVKSAQSNIGNSFGEASYRSLKDCGLGNDLLHTRELPKSRRESLETVDVFGRSKSPETRLGTSSSTSPLPPQERTGSYTYQPSPDEFYQTTAQMQMSARAGVLTPPPKTATGQPVYTDDRLR
eukprot:m.155632 g.155632  ORF g.155632 m.155632 type:complete len:222 (-) comp30946_c1_seq1:14-679(-)